MKFKEYLQEEYFIRAGNWEIFKNPSRKEIQDAMKQGKYKRLRFLLTKDGKDLYAANADCYHGYMAAEIAEEKKEEYHQDYEDKYHPLEAQYDPSYDRYFIQPSIAAIFKNDKEKDDVIKYLKQHGMTAIWGYEER
jgi:hypothetical protein